MHRLTYDCRCVLVPALALTFLASSGCGVLWSRTVPMPPEPLKVLVAQVTLKAPVTSPTDLHSFNDAPPPEIQPMLLAQLIDEVQVHAQRAFIEELSRQQAFQPVPFQEARLMLSDMPFTGEELSEAALAILGDRVGADIVVPGRILDYGAIQWQYWVSGLALSMLTETLVVGAATGFNPAIMAATAASELVTDLPFWWGGAYVGGWAFRPVRIKAEAIQITGCQKRIWTEQELVFLVPGKTLAKYPPEERQRKEVQLEVNLQHALTNLADAAGRELRLQPCT
ncbi:MAG: hypothetical protein K2X00_22235 [Nitrospiraceae bacterium]|nr:hypothetical protein [Nitrospiraceae bacterium]OQW62347.1 MAG: hypothetical protein BVN29_19445 [Nitrospira sp. ST-bin5]